MFYATDASAPGPIDVYANRESIVGHFATLRKGPSGRPRPPTRSLPCMLFFAVCLKFFESFAKTFSLISAKPVCKVFS